MGSQKNASSSSGISELITPLKGLYNSYLEQQGNVYGLKSDTAQQELAFEQFILLSPKPMLVYGEPGAGKTRTSFGIINTYYKHCQENDFRDGFVYIISYNMEIFRRELSNSLLLAQLGHFPELLKESRKRELEEPYEVLGYITLSNHVFSVLPESDINLPSHWSTEMDEYIKKGIIKINEESVSKFEGSLIILDESHNLYRNKELNVSGLALSYLIQRFPGIQVVFMDATPLMSNPEEIVPYANLMLAKQYTLEGLMDQGSMDPSENKKLYEILVKLGEQTIIITPPKNILPSIVMEGTSNESITSLNYVHINMTKRQKQEHKSLERRDDQFVIETCSTNGCESLLSSAQNDSLTNVFPTLESLFDHSGKIKMLHKILFTDELIWKDGQVFIYTNWKKFPGIKLLEHYFEFVGMSSNMSCQASRLCFVCKGKHKGGHRIEPVSYTLFHRSLTQMQFQENFDLFNSEENKNGRVAKIGIGTKSVSVSVTLQNCTSYIIFTQTVSHQMLMQLIGRTARPGGITNDALDMIIHLYYFLMSGDTIESSREEYYTRRFELIQKYTRIFLESSPSIDFVSQDTKQVGFIDNPRFIESGNHRRSKEISDYFNIRLDIPPKKKDIGIPTRHLYEHIVERIAIRFMKFLVFVNGSISLESVKAVADNMIIFEHYDVSRISMETFAKYAYKLHKMGQELRWEEFAENLTGISGDGKYLASLNITSSETLPWIYKENGEMETFRFDDNRIFSCKDKNTYARSWYITQTSFPSLEVELNPSYVKESMSSDYINEKYSPPDHLGLYDRMPLAIHHGILVNMIRKASDFRQKYKDLFDFLVINNVIVEMHDEKPSYFIARINDQWTRMEDECLELSPKMPQINKRDVPSSLRIDRKNQSLVVKLQIEPKFHPKDLRQKKTGVNIFSESIKGLAKLLNSSTYEKDHELAKSIEGLTSLKKAIKMITHTYQLRASESISKSWIIFNVH